MEESGAPSQGQVDAAETLNNSQGLWWAEGPDGAGPVCQGKSHDLSQRQGGIFSRRSNRSVDWRLLSLEEPTSSCVLKLVHLRRITGTRRKQHFVFIFLTFPTGETPWPLSASHARASR